MRLLPTNALWRNACMHCSLHRMQQCALISAHACRVFCMRFAQDAQGARAFWSGDDAPAASTAGKVPCTICGDHMKKEKMR